jgi:ribosomal-protein-alanine N-acetyltransferase
MIRPATVADLDAIDEIERHSFKLPWPRTMFLAELARDWARVDVAVNQVIAGFCNYWLVANEVHILAIATHPDHRRAGVGGRLLARALDAGLAAGCTLATLEVRRSNVPAIALYERAGFHTVHVRKRYYQEDGEDAFVMLTKLQGG